MELRDKCTLCQIIMADDLTLKIAIKNATYHSELAKKRSRSCNSRS